ncbi:hypothetical protein [Streptosporangium saharense]|uniref:hypothetical protein n=1 Tax=Streptosporangium saharense TaxID=1706840 RepID=UPI0036C3584F
MSLLQQGHEPRVHGPAPTLPTTRADQHAPLLVRPGDPAASTRWDRREVTQLRLWMCSRFPSPLET